MTDTDTTATFSNTWWIYSSDYPPIDGGIARLCAELALSRKRHELAVRVLTTAPDRNEGSSRPSVLTTRFAAPRPLCEWMVFQRLRRAPEPGPVICGLWYPDGLVTLLAGVRPFVVLAHGSELMPPRSLWRRGLWRKLQRWVLRSADLVVANSRYTREFVSATAPGSRVVAIPLGVDNRRFAPGNREDAKRHFGVSGKKVLCTVARLCAYKGHDVVLRGLASLPMQQRHQFAYLIAGKGPSLELLQRTAQELGVDSLVHWLGFVPEAQLNTVYNASDLFVLCTREVPDSQEVEGFGLAFLEAQACGVPVLGTRTGGIPDAVCEGEGGWLINQDDHRELAAVLNALALEPERFRAAGRAARARVERECTWEHYFERFRAVLCAEGIKVA